MVSLRIPARFYRLYLEDKPYGCSERDFHYVERMIEIPVGESALVLVDCWNKHYCTSYMSRSKAIIENKIVPVVEAARKAGMAIIHAPSSNVAGRYPQSKRLFEPGDEEKGPTYASVDAEWPPKEFVEREGTYSSLKRVFSPPRETWKGEYETMMIAEPVAPKPDDYVVISGSHLHKILKKLQLLHLFYVGFATNMCLQHRDYGMRAMSERGYNPILIRDCTTAVESHETLDDLLITRMSAHEIEMKYAFSTDSPGFIEACSRAK